MNETLDAIAPWVALGISGVSLWFSVIHPSRQAKIANPTAQLDLLSYELDLQSYESKSGKSQEVRVVITNSGPATMENVTVEVFDTDDQNMAVAEPDIGALWPKMPMRYLHMGQSLPLTLNLSLGSRDPRAAEVRWRDGRDGEQSRHFVLSYNRVVERV